jgi:NTP pyrophosphatase (non-canonical NTP hydrolase)
MGAYPGYHFSRYARDVAVNLPATRDVPHGHTYLAAEMADDLDQFFEAGKALDYAKKALFYGKDARPVYNSYFVTVTMRLDQCAVSADAFHGILGLATESAELVQALRDSFEDAKPLDEVNVKEEIGDCLWYLQTLATSMGTTLEECALVNTAKLKKRYPEKFTEDAAINRDVAAEREVLEQSLTSSPRDTETADHAVERQITAHYDGLIYDESSRLKPRQEPKTVAVERD